MAIRRGKYETLLCTRGPAEGECNICGEFGRLTEDHVPPRSCRAASASEMLRLHSRLAAEPEQRGRFFRRGPSYRTLCARCNNQLLGADYDPALASFCADVRRLASSNIVLPRVVQVEIQPQLVMRSVLGHLAALGIGRYEKGSMTEDFRKYMLDRTARFLEGLRFYYWFYPFRSLVLIRDAGIVNFSTHKATVFWLMKFYPLAFLITFQGEQFALSSLDQFGTIAPDSKVSIELVLRPLVHQLWPEAPTGDGAVLYGDQAVAINPRTKILPV